MLKYFLNCYTSRFLCHYKKPTYDKTLAKQVLLIDRIQDPGNLGTLIRTADAAGLDLIVMEKGTADPFQDKVIRASQEAFFIYQSFLMTSTIIFINLMVQCMGTALENAVSFNDVEAQANFALILGNEGEGVNPDLLKETTQNLTIPIYGKAESLNVAIAGSILMYQLKG